MASTANCDLMETNLTGDSKLKVDPSSLTRVKIMPAKNVTSLIGFTFERSH